MSEPVLYNQTDYFAQPLPMLARDGTDCRLVVLKASFGVQLDGRVLKLRRQRPLRDGDEPWESPEVPDVRYPGDVCLYRPGTDFLVVGSARTPSAVPARRIEVTIQVANRVMRLRVCGPRTFRRTLFGIRPSRPEPFVAAPLSWSRAWGGTDLSHPKRPRQNRWNPVGRGVARQRRELVGRPAPQVEPTGWRRNKPAGCAPIGASFEPRRTHAGTYDSTWVQQVYPAKPADYDPRHENRAAPGLVFERALRGTEPVRIVNMSHDGPLEFNLPRVYPVFAATIDGATETQRPHLDSVLVDVDARVVEMTWRAVFSCPAKLRSRFREISVQERRVL